MKRLALCALLVGTVACGGSPSSPSEQVANYSGNWSGTYSVTGCNQSGGVALVNICGSLGQTPPYSMSLTQTGRNVSGTFRLGQIEFPQTGGSVGNDGSLALNGTSQSNGITIVVAWNLHKSATAITGTVSQNWASATLSGGATVTGQINTSNRAVTAPAPVNLSGLTLGQLGQLAGK